MVAAGSHREDRGNPDVRRGWTTGATAAADGRDARPLVVSGVAGSSRRAAAGHCRQPALAPSVAAENPRHRRTVGNYEDGTAGADHYGDCGQLVTGEVRLTDETGRKGVRSVAATPPISAVPNLKL